MPGRIISLVKTLWQRWFFLMSSNCGPKLKSRLWLSHILWQIHTCNLSVKKKLWSLNDVKMKVMALKASICWDVTKAPLSAGSFPWSCASQPLAKARLAAMCLFSVISGWQILIWSEKCLHFGPFDEPKKSHPQRHFCAWQNKSLVR